MVLGRDSALIEGTAESPDAPYAVVAGLYVAALVSPLAVLALASITTAAGVLYAGFLSAGTGVAIVAGWSVYRMPGLAIRIGRSGLARLLPVVPVIWVVSVFGVATAVGDPAGGAVLLSMMATLGGLFLGLMLVTMSRTRYATAVLTTTEERAQWEARWPKRWRQFALTGLVIAGVLGVGGVVWRFLFGPGWHWAGYLYLLVFLWTPFAGASNPRTFRVTDAGLIVERPLQRQFISWSSISGYTLTDDALIVSRSAWWRPAYRCDRTDIEEVDAVTTALANSVGQNSE